MALRPSPFANRGWNNPALGAGFGNLASALFAGGGGSPEAQAQADYYAAKTKEQQIKNFALQDTQNRMAPGEDPTAVFANLLQSGNAADIGDILLARAAQLPGATMGGLGLSQLGAGQAYNTTVAGTEAGFANDRTMQGMRDKVEMDKFLQGDAKLSQGEAGIYSPERRAALGLGDQGTVESPVLGVIQTPKAGMTTVPGQDDPIVNAIVPSDFGGGPEGKSNAAWAVNVMRNPASTPDDVALAQFILQHPTTLPGPTGDYQIIRPDLPQLQARQQGAAPGVLPPVAPAPVPGQAVPAPLGTGIQATAPPVPGVGGATPAPSAGGPPLQGAAPSITQPAPAPAAALPGAPGGVPGAPINVGGATVQTLPGTGRNVPQTEFQGKARTWGTQMVNANALMEQQAAGDPASGRKPYASPDVAAWRIDANFPPDVANSLLSPDAVRFFSFRDQFLGPILRQESGAAIAESEYPRYFRRFIPLPNDPADVLAAKSVARQTASQLLVQAAGTQTQRLTPEQERDRAEQIYMAVGDPYAAAMSGGPPQAGPQPGGETVIRYDDQGNRIP